MPIYAGPLSLALIRGKLEEHGLLRDAKLFEIHPDDEIAFKYLKLSFFRRLTQFRAYRHGHRYTAR